ncbi:hypothetical protein M5236_004855 [Vibrio parahaemolyticus]|nr:hypothetical protein [Vibrio parahaemolyticus]
MTKIQCTFRLPQQVVELIDSQNGKDRTDKLLSLLGQSGVEPKNGVMQSVIAYFGDCERLFRFILNT